MCLYRGILAGERPRVVEGFDSQRDRRILRVLSRPCPGLVQAMVMLWPHRGVDRHADEDLALILACNEGGPGVGELLELYLRDESTPAAALHRALVGAAYHGRAEVVRMLAASGRCDRACFGDFAMRVAVATGDVGVVGALLESEKDDASEGGDIDGGLKLRKAEDRALGYDDGENGRRKGAALALHLAAGFGSVDVTKFLVESGRLGKEPAAVRHAVHMASDKGYQPVVKLLKT
ncbi:hypothetical protein HK101_006534, partial [Irineochytrium annulatum]